MAIIALCMPRNNSSAKLIIHTSTAYNCSLSLILNLFILAVRQLYNTTRRIIAEYSRHLYQTITQQSIFVWSRYTRQLSTRIRRRPAAITYMYSILPNTCLSLSVSLGETIRCCTLLINIGAREPSINLASITQRPAYVCVYVLRFEYAWQLEIVAVIPS